MNVLAIVPLVPRSAVRCDLAQPCVAAVVT
jgi:hypothetical protein